MTGRVRWQRCSIQIWFGASNRKDRATTTGWHRKQGNNIALTKRVVKWVGNRTSGHVSTPVCATATGKEHERWKGTKTKWSPSGVSWTQQAWKGGLQQGTACMASARREQRHPHWGRCQIERNIWWLGTSPRHSPVHCTTVHSTGSKHDPQTESNADFDDCGKVQCPWN